MKYIKFYKKIIIPLSLIGLIQINSSSVFANTLMQNDILINRSINREAIENNYIPLNDTFKNLGFKSISNNDNLLKFEKDGKIINFVYESNYNLKKNTNTYYYKLLNNKAYIKAEVLLDLGYNISTYKNKYYINIDNEKVFLNTELFLLDLLEISKTSKNINNNKTFHDRNIIKENLNINEIEDYSIENRNLMNYNLQDLQEYIKVNYNCNLEEYKNNLVSIYDKYSNVEIINIKLLDNGQVFVILSGNNLKNSGKNSIFIELGIEVKDGKILVEK